MKYFSYIKWSVVVLLVGYIVWQSLFAAGSLIAVTDFRERTPYFDVLLPAGRVERTEVGIVLKQEPVYIDVRLPVRAKSVILELAVANTRTPVKLAWQVNENFSLSFSDLEPISAGNQVLYRYNLTNINYVRSGHKVRFVISSPGLVPGTVIVKKANVSIKRERANLAWWHQHLVDLWPN